MGLRNNFCNLIIWKSLSSRSRKLESEVSKLNPRFFKNSWRSKNGPKIAKLFLCFLTTWWKLSFQNRYQMIDPNFLEYHNFHQVVRKKRNNLAIFGRFLDLQELLKNRVLSFETSDSDFRDLLDDLFHMIQ